MGIFNKLFVKAKVFHVYAERKQKEIRELEEEVNALKAELLNQSLELAEKDTKLIHALEERNLFYSNLTKAKKEKLAAERPNLNS